MSSVDVIVVGGGMGGIYATYRFRRQGLSVLGLEGGGGFGGVWYHNRYPGARVDVDSLDYCFYFSREIAMSWRWTERYAAQPELLRYLNFVADHYDLGKHFRFDTWMTSGRWNPAAGEWEVATSAGETIRGQFLVMATGNLSRAREPSFVGRDRFRGESVMTSHWPQGGVDLAGRRIGVIGTGSTGVQVVAAVAPYAERLTVFQRTANYVVPAVNHPLDSETQRRLAERLSEERALLLQTPSGTRVPQPKGVAAEFSACEQIELLERQWQFGGQGMGRVFADQGRDLGTNRIVAEFVRYKVRQTVNDRQIAEKLLPRAYPIGTRRLALDIGYYETFNRANVALVDIRREPIVEFTRAGVRTATRHHDLDVIIFAMGFHAFTGAIEAANIRNERDEAPTGRWTRGPRTVLGLMTPGFPNLFFPTGAGGPSLIANLFLNNEFCIDWIADAIAYMNERGVATIEPTEAAATAWQKRVAEAAAPLLRLRYDNYMVHVNDDGSRYYRPYAGGFGRFVEEADAYAESGYLGFAMRTTRGSRPDAPMRWAARA